MKKGLFPVFIFLCYSFFGQKENKPTETEIRIDSLSLVLKRCNQDSIKVNTLNKLAWELNYSNFNSAIEISNKALELAEKLSWREGMASSLYCLAYFNTFKGNYSEAKTQLNKSLAIWEENIKGSKQRNLNYYYHNKGLVLCQLGRLMYINGNNFESIVILQEAMEIAKKQKDKYLAMIANQHLVGNYNSTRDSSKALFHALTAIKLSKEIGNKYDIARSFAVLGAAYWYPLNTKKSKDALLIALKLAETNGFYFLRSQINEWIAHNYFLEKDYSKCLEHSFIALKEYERIGYRSRICNSYGTIGSAYVELGNLKKAIFYFKRGIELSDSFKIFNDHEMGSAQALSQLYEKTGRFDLALKYHKLSDAIEDTVTNQESQKKLTQMILAKEYEKKESDLKTEQEKKDSAAAEEKRKQILIRNGIAIGLAIVLVFSILVFRQRNKIAKEPQAQKNKFTI